MAVRESEGGTEDPRVTRSRQVIRRAVLDELAEVGFGALTIEAVARRAGVGKATIYRHWTGRVELIADAFEHAHHDMVPEMECATARQRVVQLVGHVATIVNDPLFSRCIPALIEGAERDVRLRSFHHQFGALRRRELAAAIDDGIASGEIDASIAADVAAVGLLGVIFYRRLMTPEPLAPEEADALVSALLRSPASV